MFRRYIVLTLTIFFLLLFYKPLFAFTYKYRNMTCYPIKVHVELYDGIVSDTELSPNESFTLSTLSLLKNWAVTALIEDKWEQVLTLTCDFLPRDYFFTVYLRKRKSHDGSIILSWEAINNQD